MTSEKDKKAKVVIVKSSDVSEAVENALNLVGGFEKVVSEAPSILLKPNFCGGVEGVTHQRCRFRNSA
ncbi:MAG: hypothetical protein JRI87_12760 [Deltaproteobacteria bacterium]|nr:hypothetical protein [Deltaproteobacteria bacterium]